MAAVAAQHEAAQGEVCRDILFDRRAGGLFQPGLDSLESLEADQPFMPPLAQGDIPAWQLDIPRIERLDEHVLDALVADIAARQVFREFRSRLEKPLELDLRLEATGGKPLQPLGNDGGQRFIAHQNAPAALLGCKAIAFRRPEHPISVQDTRAHTVLGLLRVLLALVLRDRGHHVLDQNRVRVFSELDGRADERTACASDQFPQLPVRGDAPRQAGDVINDHGGRVGAVVFQKREHRRHPGAVRAPAAHIVREDVHDLQGLEAGELPAAGFLRAQPVMLGSLLGIGDAAIDDRERSGCRFGCGLLHYASFFL